MNKYVISTLVLAVFAATGATPVLADESPSPSPSPSGSPGIRREIRQEVNDARKKAKEESQAKLQAKREADRIKRTSEFWAKTTERLGDLIKREIKIADKIASRLAKFKEAGKNVDTQAAVLIAARAKITAAQTALDSAISDPTLKALIEGGKSMNEIQARIRVLHKGVIAAIREAHKALVAVVVSTRGLSATPSPTPTP